MNPESGINLEQYDKGPVSSDPMVEAGRGLFAFDLIKKATDLPWMVGSAAKMAESVLHFSKKLSSIALGVTPSIGPEPNSPVFQAATPVSTGGGAT